MFSKELQIMDRNTVKYMIDELQEQLDTANEKLDTLTNKNNSLTAENERLLKLLKDNGINP